MQAKRKKKIIYQNRQMTCITTKKKVNTCKNESSGERERENERAGNQFKKALDLRQC